MPDQPPSDWIDSNPNQPPNDWVDSSSNQPSKSPEPDWGDWAIEQGLSIVPPIAGAMLGGPAGGALGGFGGSYLRQLYDVNKGFKKDINPWVMGTEAALGGLPIPGHVPGAGATAEELMKYAAKAPFRGAAEGAVIGGGAAVPMSYAETGEAPSWGEVGKGALAGGAFGLAGGAAFGSIPAISRAHAPAPPIEPPAFMRPGNTVPPAEPPTGGVARPLSDEMPPFMRPPSHEVNEPPPITQQPPPVQGPQIPPESALAGVSGQPVSIRGLDEAAKTDLKRQGYKPNGFDADGFAIWALPPGGAQKSEIPAPPAGSTPFHEDDVITIPKEKLRDKTFVQNLMNGGMELVGRDEQGNGLFKRNVDDSPSYELVKPPEDAFNKGTGAQPGEQTGRVAPFDKGFVPEESQGIYDQPTDPAKLQDFLGELHGRMNAEASGEPWDQLWKRYLDLEAKNDNGPLSPADSNELNRLRFTIKDHPGWKAKVDKLAEDAKNDPAMARRAIEFFTKGFPDDPYNKPLSLRETSDLLGIPEEQLRQTLEPDTVDPAVRDNLLTKLRGMNQPTDVRNPANEIPNALTLRRAQQFKQHWQTQLQQAIDKGDVEGANYASKVNQYIDQQISRFEGQESNRPVSFDIHDPANEILPTGDVSEIRRRNTLRPVENQQDVNLGQFTDDQIRKYLIKEDATPPEAHDINMPPDEPSFAKVKGGGLVIDADINRAAENITKDYTSPIAAIMGREGMQNALDAADRLGMNGRVRVRVERYPDSGNHYLEIHDNGAGLDETGLAEKLVRLFASGKSNETGATGGKGIGSASYILGGERFEIDTVSVDRTTGKKYRIQAGGTPDQFLDATKGSDWKKVTVSDNTPTGTTMKVTLKNGQDSFDTTNMIDNIIEHSRNRPSTVIRDKYGIYSKRTTLSDMKPDAHGNITEHAFATHADDKMIGNFVTKNSEVKVLVPKYDPTVERNSVKVHYLNNGMYQFSEDLYIGGKVMSDVPEHVLVDVHPLVDEMHDDYPFINTREDMKKDIKGTIEKYLDENIKNPAIDARKNRTQELYDSMSPVTVPGLKRQSVIFDPGNRLTPDEMAAFSSHPVVQALASHYDGLINDILTASNRPKWADRLEGVGLVLDPNMNGVHIPNPTTGKSTILINPFARMEMGVNPANNAFDNTITNLHEVAHIGIESGARVSLSPDDLNDPRVGKYLASYINQLVDHGDVGFTSTGHGMGFAHRLGEVYGTYGAKRTFAAADQLEHIFTGGNKTGGYSPELQELLQVYTERKGRPAVTEDLLSGTGVKQANKATGGEEGIPRNSGGDGEGIAPVKKEKDPSVLRELYNAPRAFTTPLDLSASARQGLPLVTRKEWWTSWKQQLSALGSEKGYQKTLADLKKRPLFQAQVDMTTGKVEKSFAEKVGMKLSDVSTNLNKREESIASNWLETGKMFGKDNPIQGAYKATIGDAARASNRAYTAFLNQLRADTFESLLKEAHTDFIAGTKGARNPYEDLTFAREIADYVNTATGRGPLKIARPTIEGGRVGLKESSFEQHAKLLTDSLFSPRLFASRVRMLNPATYMMASPFVRKQYVKSLLSVAGAWGTISALGKMAGADVSLDPNSADFGKIRIGNTRLDPAGGFQQYLVAASRLISGHTTSSASGQDFELGQGYRPPTRKDIAQNFAVNKLHPVLKFGYDLLNASQHQPFNVADRTAQLFVPLIVGDVIDLAKEDPSLLPLIAPISLGMGSQTYDKGQTQNKFVPQGYGFDFTGGNPF